MPASHPWRTARREAKRESAMMRAVHLIALAAALAGRAGHRRAGWLAAAALANVGGAPLMCGLGLLPLPRLAPRPA